MNLDLVLLTASIVLTVLLAAVGIEMANNPPTSGRQKWGYRSVFIILGCSLVGVTYWQGKRNGDEQNKIRVDSRTQEQQLAAENNQIQGKLDAIKQFLADPPASLDAKQVAAAVRTMTEPLKDITLAIGNSVNSNYAFETRFILTNHNSRPLTQGSYACEIQNVDTTGFLKLDKPIQMNFAATGPIEDLPSEGSRSLYCDFSQSEFLLGKMDPLVVQIWVSYSYNSNKRNKGFRFFAKRRGDGTFAWFEGGAAGHPKDPNK
jgi:hypothetical protein